MSVVESFNLGKLDEAVEQAIQSVKKSPNDITQRHLLCEMFCLRGELDRADRQLETLISQKPDAAMPLALFRQLIRAETARQECYREGRVPELLQKPDAIIETMIQAWMSRREGNLAQAAELLQKVEELRETCSGTCNEKPFGDVRDQDDFSSFFLETLTSTGKYYWIPIHRVEAMEVHRPTRPRDTLWVRATMSVEEGPDGEVYLPTMYLGSEASSDVNLKLGRATEWVEGQAGVVQGVGRRMFWFDEDELSILDIQSLSIDHS